MLAIDPHNSANRYVGVDITTGAFVAVVLNDDAYVEAHYAPTLTALVSVFASATVIAIDVPIGLSDTGPRACDQAARTQLGARRASLFMTPVRDALTADTHAKASAINTAITAKGISMQAFGLRHKIAETRTFIETTGLTLYETHPETAFAVLHGAPLTTTKTSWAGMRQREQILANNGVLLDACLPAGAKVGIDDMLDAAVAALSARRIANGNALVLGDDTRDPQLHVPLHIYV